jgi:hypothetical protein
MLRGPVPFAALGWKYYAEIKCERAVWRDATVTKQLVSGTICTAVSAATLLLATACSAPDSEALPALDAERAEEPSAVASDASYTGGDESATDLGVEPDLLALEETWAETWGASGAPGEESARQTVKTHPVFTPSADGSTVAIEDCVIHEPPIEGSATHAFAGVAVTNDEGWTISSVSSEASACVPAELNRQILGDYLAYWDARRIYRNPADPTDPAIQQTTTGNYQVAVLARLELDRERGLSQVQDQSVNHPEVILLTSATQVQISDCVETHPNDGIFNADGAREPGNRQPRPGGRDLYTVAMVLEDDRWRVADMFIQTDSECISPPTAAGLTIIGEG